jgi:hypothetical protein
MTRELSLGESPQKYIEDVADGYLAGGPRQNERATVAGQSVEITWMTRTPTNVALLTHFDRAEGSRIVGCRDRTNRCLAMLEFFAAAPWGSGPIGGAVEMEVRLVFLGRPITAPTGCRADAAPNGGRIECPNGSVAWVTAPDEASAQRNMDVAIGRIEEALTALPVHPQRSEAPCRLAGVDATCMQIRVGGGAHRARGGRGDRRHGGSRNLYLEGSRGDRNALQSGLREVKMPGSEVRSVWSLRLRSGYFLLLRTHTLTRMPAPW